MPRVTTSEGGIGQVMTDSVDSNGSISLALPAMGAPPYVSSPRTTGLIHKPPPLVSNNWTTHHHRGYGGGTGGGGGGGGLETGLTTRVRPPFLTKELALVPQPTVRLGASATGRFPTYDPPPPYKHTYIHFLVLTYPS